MYVTALLGLTAIFCMFSVEDSALTGALLKIWDKDTAFSSTTINTSSTEKNATVTTGKVMTTRSDVPGIQNETYYLPGERNGYTQTTTDSPVTDNVDVLPHFEPPEIITCKGKCGHIMEMPCSCDVKCLIYRNCCENMTTDCPEVLDEARSRFDALLRSDVICYEDGYFMISSCPHKGGRPEDVTLTNRTPVTIQHPSSWHFTTRNGSVKTSETTTPGTASHVVTSDMNTNDWTQTTTHNLLDFLRLNVPVVDTSTGFVFVNESIASCHGLNHSRALPFNVQLKPISDPEYPFTLEMLEKAFSWENVIYIPPSLPEDSVALSHCIHYAIDTCSREMAETDMNLQELCQSFISYVGQAKTDIYANRFCYECNMDYHIQVKPILKKPAYPKGFRFSATFDLSQSNAVRITSVEFMETGYFPWKEATCNDHKTSDTSVEGSLVHQEEEEPNQSSLSNNQDCTIESCASWYHLRPDGTCKMLHEVFMGFADNGFPFNAHEINQLPRVVACFLETFFEIEISEKMSPTEILFDTRVNTSLYLVKMEVFLPHVTNTLFALNFQEGYSKLSSLSKAFKDYRKERFLKEYNVSQEVAHSLDKVNPCLDSTSETYHKECRVIKSENMIRSYPHLNKYPGRGQLLDNSTTTMCCSDYLHGTFSSNLLLLCWENGFYEMDVTMIEEYAKSRCMALFHGQARSGVDQLNVSKVILVELGCVCVSLISVLLISNNQ